jgi:uncharacterized membrane protein
MKEARNPYSPPEALVADPASDLGDSRGLLVNGRQVPIGNSVLWVSEAFHLFFGKPWKWLGTTLLLLLISMIVSLAPFSNLLTTILWPVAAGGVAYALDVQRQTQNFALHDVFAGFGSKFLPLAAVGCVAMLTAVIMFAVFLVMADSEVALAMALGGRQLSVLPPNFWWALLITMVLAVPLTSATFLAPPLIVLHGLTPGQAMKMSFFACLKNIAPWTAFALLMVLLILLSIIPLFLGLLVTLPVAGIGFYAMYRDVFVKEP